MIIIGITLFKSNYSYAIGGNPSKSTLQSDGGGKPQLDSEKLYKDQNYYKPTTEEMPAKLQNIVGVILGGIRTLGIILSVICLMAIGIKFMVGSVEQKLGETIVGDDFELICWDVVSDPSTPGAYIGKETELHQYVEASQRPNSKSSILSEKIDKIFNILSS